MQNIGIQPIMGAQINLQDTQGLGEVVLLAKNEIGYVNLSKLLSKTLLEAEATHDPACVLDDLAALADGFIINWWRYCWICWWSCW